MPMAATPEAAPSLDIPLVSSYAGCGSRAPITAQVTVIEPHPAEEYIGQELRTEIQGMAIHRATLSQ